MTGAATRMTRPASTMFERLLRWRNRLISNSRFQRWAAGFPLTRHVAQKNARSLFDLCAGFVYSQTLLAAKRFGLFSLLAERARTPFEIASRNGLDIDACETLLRAGASLRLFERLPDGRYALGELGAALLGNPGVLDMIEHHDALYADLADPVALLSDRTRPTRLSAFWGYAAARDPESLGPSDVDPYSRLMASSQSLVSEDILEAFPFVKTRKLLDVGGGAGAFAVAALRKYPALAATVFDLPAVAALAQARFAREGFAPRATIVSGDFHKGALPRGADVVSLVRVLHDHDDDKARALIRRAYDALEDGGTLLVAEPMAGAPGAEAMGEAYFGFYLFAMGSGRPRRAEDIIRFAREAGFRSTQVLRTRRPLLVSVVVARR